MYKNCLSPYFLFLATSALLVYEAPFLWPLLLVACLGSFCARYFKKAGLYAAAALLLLYIAFDYSRLVEQSWLFYFLGSILMSWVIERLQPEEVIQPVEEKTPPNALFFPPPIKEESVCQNNLKDQTSEVEPIFSEGLSANVSLPMESSEETPPRYFREISLRYEQVKKQFIEKSEVLNIARRELFQTETALFTAQKQKEEEQIYPSEQMRASLQEIQRLEQLCLDLEEEVVVLEQVIGQLMVPIKKQRAPRKKKATQESLDLLIRLNEMEQVAQKGQSHFDQNQ